MRQHHAHPAPPAIADADSRCRICGCTEHQHCPGGCYWLFRSVCSACFHRWQAAQSRVKPHDPRHPDDLFVLVEAIRAKTHTSLCVTLAGIADALRANDLRLEIEPTYPSTVRVVPLHRLAQEIGRRKEAHRAPAP